MAEQNQNSLGLEDTGGVEKVNEFKFEPIKGYPMLNWRGKRPFTSTQYYPAQLKEIYGEEVDGWRNKIFWGDNLQVMSHLLKEFRGKVDLIYIDPPFDSKADYKKKVSLRGKDIHGFVSSFEEKQYTDIWSNDEYLQFIYERLVLLKELLSKEGSIYIHCDPTRGHYIKVICDEIFGSGNFLNQIIWKRTFSHGDTSQGAAHFGRLHDLILFYRKSPAASTNTVYTPYSEKYIKDFYKYVEDDGRRYRLVSLLGPGGASKGNPFYEFLGVSKYWVYSKQKMTELHEKGLIVQTKPGGVPQRKRYIDEAPGTPLQDIWADINAVQGGALEREDYPTQKPEKLLERIIRASSKKGGLVLDVFMGSGTTQEVALRLGRKFIGADINVGAIQTASRRLVEAASEVKSEFSKMPQSYNWGNTDSISKEVIDKVYTGLEVFNVNNYDIFRNPLEAKELLLEALEIQKIEFNTIFDGEKDGRMVKIMPVNRICTKADLGELIAGFDYKTWQTRQNEKPNQPVEKILLVCMGHEPSLKAELEIAAKPFKIDVEVLDILRDKSNLEFKRDSEALVTQKNGELVIDRFYPMNLLQKLSLQKETVTDWREMVESIMIDWNYDGAVLQPSVVDIPEKDELVSGKYKVPADAGTIRVKITDVLSESWEGGING